MQKIDLKNPALQKIVLSVVLSVGLLGVFFFTHLLPFTYPVQSERLNTLKAEYEKKSTELARARATVSDLPRFEAEYEHLHQRWVMAAELLPTDRQLAALLRKITLAAQQTGVEFLVFRPNDSKVEQHYTELPLQLSVYGDYHRVGSFLAELANMRRILTVSNLQLKGNVRDDQPITEAEFTASAYSLNANASTPPAPAAGGKEGEPHARKS
jgi:type IV pilus assembly protein PilO